ncbi:MAG: TetR/AcrR family transcriptional regulator [bacterium]|nr:TetR/AcrR family transcriptional regulator [bacterium]
MAKQIEGVSERILDCAKREFLDRGFMDASLRTIAAEADTTTGSIYTRFGDKEGLFQAIVEPVADEMMRMYMEIQETFHAFDDEMQKAEMGNYTSRAMDTILDYIYDHFDVFRLLLDASYGTKFQNFVDELVQIEVEYTYKYMEVIGCESVKSGMVTEEFLHIVTTSYFNGVFEVVRHRMEKESARRYVKMLEKYHMAGFDTIFSPEKYETYEKRALEESIGKNIRK